MGAGPVPIRGVAIKQRDQIHGVVVGTLVGVNPEGQMLVHFPGAPDAEVVARIATHDPAFASEIGALRGQSVLLAFEANERTLPLIIGIVRDTLQSPAAVKPDASPGPPTIGAPGEPLTLNGRRLVFNGQEEIVFRCGQGSITIRADGSIVVKGTRLLSRASEVNKIRGASVQIN